jgi:hypothetical protein
MLWSWIRVNAFALPLFTIHGSLFRVSLSKIVEGNMNQKILASITAIIALLFFSCEKKDASPAAGAVVESDAAEAVVAYAGNPGFVLRPNASLMVLEADTGSEADTVKWAVTMNLGDKIMIGETRRATWNRDVFDFFEIRTDSGREGLAFARQVAVGGDLAVVVDEKANLYRTPKTTDVTGDIISRKTIVVYFPETESGGYVEIKAFDPVVEFYRQSFVRISSLSRKEADVQSSIYLQIAQPLKDEGTDKNIKEALLGAALNDFPDSVFYAEIYALAYPNAAAAIRTESVSMFFLTVNDDDVIVRDLPDSVAGKIIGQLSNGDEVLVNEQTVNTSTIGRINARWYHIIEPFDGWVFGAFLD